MGHRGLLDPIKPAYNQSRPDGRLKLTAEPLTNYGSVCRQSWSHNSLHPINFLHYCLPSPDFMVQRKVTEADTLRGCHPIWTIGVPTSTVPPFFMPNALSGAPSQSILAWQRHQIMLVCICSVYNQLINMLKVYIPVESCYNTYTGHIDMQCGMCRQLRN